MSKELTQYQFQEQLMDVHLGSVEVRVKSMACLRNHDAAQRATIQQLEARIVSLEIDVDRMAWKTSPATAQATIDQLVKQNDQLEAQVKELEEESRQWEKGSLVALLRENKALKALVVQLQGEA